MTAEFSKQMGGPELQEVESLTIKEALRELPGALKAVSAERRNYAETIRKSRWAEGPVMILGQGKALHAARAGAEAFEWLLGWPSLARETAEFLQYSGALLRPRSTLIVVSRSGESEEAIEVTRRASRSGANVLALTTSAGSSLAQAARAHLTLSALPAAEGDPEFAASIAEHVSLFEIATAAAGILNPRNQHIEAVASGLERLPEHVLWMQTHLRDSIRVCGKDLSRTSHFVIVGGNFYRHAAAQAAAFGRRVTSRFVVAIEAGDIFPATSGASDAFFLLSGSRSRGKNALHGLAHKLKAGPSKLISLTDANDRDLIRLSDVALLAPELPPIPGSVLTLSLLAWLFLECSPGAAAGLAECKNTEG